MNMMALTIAVGLCFMVAERIFPDQNLPQVKGWWVRVIIVNLLQLGVAIGAGKLWDAYFAGASFFDMDAGMAAPLAGFYGYLILTFIYYWWHRWRHEVNFLWLSFHQLHHSPSRIETITSFYKHPAEISVNMVIINVVCYTVLGLSVEATAWVNFWSGLGEYIYHMNIKTPHWMGYFFQRPEMHRIHHQRGLHFYNFSDIPLWDKLFGTYKNPKEQYAPCGFKPERELMFKEILAFKNVNNPYGGKNAGRKES